MAADRVAEKRNRYLEVAKGERRTPCKVNGRMAWRNKKDDGFRPEFQGIDKTVRVFTP